MKKGEIKKTEKETEKNTWSRKISFLEEKENF